MTFLRINNIPIQDKNTPTKFPVNEIKQCQPIRTNYPYLQNLVIYDLFLMKKKIINLPIQGMYTPAKFHVHQSKTKEVLAIIQKSRNRSQGSPQDR